MGQQHKARKAQINAHLVFAWGSGPLNKEYQGESAHMASSFVGYFPVFVFVVEIKLYCYV